jgi:hypothetical protein
MERGIKHMRFWLTAFVSLLFAVPATAQQLSKVAVSGKPVILDFIFNTAPDCTNFGYAEVRITSQPQNGRVSVTRTTNFPSFPASNIRHVCNSRRVPGVEVRYTSQAGFLGTDYVSVESISPQGSSFSRRFAITVK